MLFCKDCFLQRLTLQRLMVSRHVHFLLVSLIPKPLKAEFDVAVGFFQNASCLGKKLQFNTGWKEFFSLFRETSSNACYIQLLIHIYSLCGRNKSPSWPSHNSEFTVQKGSQKDNKGNNRCKSNPCTFRLALIRRQREVRRKRELKGQFHTNQCRETEEQLLKLD